MKKLVCAILTVVFVLCCAGAVAQELQIPEVSWDYPVMLTDLQSEYLVLVNEDHLLD